MGNGYKKPSKKKSEIKNKNSAKTYKSTFSSKHIAFLEQKVVLGLPLSQYLHLPEKEISTGLTQEKANKLLEYSIEIKNNTPIQESIDFIMHEGKRSIYNILIPYFLKQKDKNERKEELKKRYMGIDLFLKYSENLSDCLEAIQNPPFCINEEDIIRGILAWDMVHLVTLTRISWDAGYLSQKEMLFYLEEAYKQCKNKFSNWEEVGKSFIIGEAMAAGSTSQFNLFIKILSNLLTNNESLWQKINFK